VFFLKFRNPIDSSIENDDSNSLIATANALVSIAFKDSIYSFTLEFMAFKSVILFSLKISILKSINTLIYYSINNFIYKLLSILFFYSNMYVYMFNINAYITFLLL